VTPLTALNKHDPDNGSWGDCQRICIAAILDLPPEQVPHFCDNDNPDWLIHLTDWLARRGLAYARFGYVGEGITLEQIYSWTTEANPGVPMILHGKSSIGTNHVVVIQDGAIVCDSSGNGIVGPNNEGLYHVEVISIGNDWGARSRAAYALGGLVMDAIADVEDPGNLDSTVRFDFIGAPFAFTLRRDLEDAGPADAISTRKHEDGWQINERLAAIADQVVPEYRAKGASYSCTGHVAHKWNAAYEGAARALGVQIKFDGSEFVVSSRKSDEPLTEADMPH